MMSRLTAFNVCAYLGLFFCLVVMRIDNINDKSQMGLLNNKSMDVDLLHIRQEKLGRRQVELMDAMVYMKKRQGNHGIDIAKLIMTRTSTIKEVDLIVQEAIKENNRLEDEYNSLVAETIMRLEENMKLSGDINEVRAEIIKREILKELKK